ncbi:outer membrane protein assembly factor BamC [Thalassotalea sp. HSM 43]|uniref:outer membrane protein assembly factor BamC n=1 Tax=Thalassotalea sp. HSM 43 TaxID=2552945 RepID=UPI001081DAF2|nr:outer membrane protein assembly factor BamC [Thalassotalea sp. HSM 43]QBY05618.1 outer membrane protein assembly factor BamC [Thalassotalea sp. HSM 43]
MDRRVIYLSLLGLALSACSNVETRKEAKGDFDYVNFKPEAELKVPDGMTPPAKKQLFAVPELKNTDGAVGQAVDIRAPAQVLPLASGSRIDEFDKTAAIWFDKVDDNRELRDQIVKAIKDYLQTEDVALTVEDESNNLFESDWFHVEDESGYLFWKSVDITESWRFKYTLVTKPHGRSVGLNVELVDYMLTNDKGSTKKIDPIEKQRVEMAMLNAVTGQLDYQYRINNRDDRLARANMQIVELGQTNDGEPALIIDYPRDELWSYLPGFFEQYNFIITDIDEDKFVFDVEYTYVEASVWDTVWGDDAPVVDIPDGTYRFKLKDSDGKTELIITDDQNNNLGDESLKKNFEVLEPALSFR